MRWQTAVLDQFNDFCAEATVKTGVRGTRATYPIELNGYWFSRGNMATGSARSESE